MSDHAKRATLACVALLLLATTASAQPYDHLKCYKITDTQTFDSASADIDTIEAAFGLQNCTIKKKAKQFCIPASKDVTAISGGTDDPFAAQGLLFEQICYKISCPNVTIPDQQVSDQFGTRTVTGLKAKTLCVPAVIGPAPTTTTTSTTTSTTMAAPSTWSLRAGDALAQQATGVAVDSAGNVIVVGSFAGQINFGLGALTSAGGDDIFIVKLDSSGAPIWNASFGDAGQQTPADVAVDSADRIVVAGIFNGSVDFGGGALTSAGNFDGFVAQFNSAGVHQWSARYGDTLLDAVLSVALTSMDEVVLTGYFASASIDFGGGPISLVGTLDGFLAKLSSGGAHTWSQGFGGASASVQLTGVDVDPSDNVLVAGSLSGSVNFGGGPLASSGLQDALVLKRNSAGSHVWSKKFGDASNQTASNVAADAAGNVLVTGSAAGTTDFGGGGLTSAGGNDVVLAKLDPSGSHMWSHIYGDAAAQAAFDVAADPMGNVLASGNTSGVINFGGGNLGGAGGQDAYLAKLTAGGAHTSSQAFADVGNQAAFGIVSDSLGNRYVVGSFAGTVDFGNGPLMSAGANDLFVVKLAP